MRTLFLLLAFLYSERVYCQELRIGDLAPPLKLEKFIKGKKLNEYQRGKIYVLDFWNISCELCKTTFPHLSLLSNKYKSKQVEFIGVNISERDPNQVIIFLENLNRKINYAIALDNGYMYKTFLKPLNGSLPTTIIIGKTGIVEWVGFSMDLENVLQKVINDSWDVKTNSTKVLVTPNKSIGKDPDWSSMKNELMLTYANLNPDSIVLSWQYPYYLKNKDYAKYCISLTAFVDQFVSKLNPNLMNSYAWKIFKFSTSSKELKTAASWLISDAASIHPGALDTYANIQYKLGHRLKAIRTQKKALNLLDQDVYVNDLSQNYYKMLTNEPTWQVLGEKTYYTNDKLVWQRIFKALKGYSKHEADSLIVLAKVAYMKNAGRWNDLTTAVEESIAFTERKGKFLNNLAWMVFSSCTDPIQLNKVLGWTEKTLLDSSSSSSYYNFYDTKANILHKLGRSSESVLAQMKAIELCPENEKGRFQATLAKIEKGEPTW